MNDSRELWGVFEKFGMGGTAGNNLNKAKVIKQYDTDVLHNRDLMPAAFRE